MIRTLRAALLLAITAIPSLAVRRPEPDANPLDKAMLAEAEEQIRLAREQEVALIGEYTQLGLARKAVFSARNEEERELRQADIVAIEGRIAGVKIFRNWYYSKAANIVVKLYDLYPPSRTGTSVMPAPFTNMPATWVVMFDEPKPRKVLDENGELHWVETKTKRAEAVTFFDGTTVLRERAFSSIPFLAATIYHERVHFEQYITKGVGDRLSRHQREVKAYEAELQMADLFQLPQTERDRLRSRQDDYALGLDPIPGAGEWYVRRPEHDQHDLEGDLDLMPHTAEELDNIRFNGRVLERSVNEAFERRSEELRRQQAREDQARSEAAWDALMASARGCGFDVQAHNGGIFPRQVTVLDQGLSEFGSFSFEFGGDVEAARLAFLVLRACATRPESSCNDVLDRMPADRWNTDELWKRVVPLKGYHHALFCVHDLHAYRQPTTSYPEVLRQIRENDQRRSEAYRRDAERRERRSPPPEREPRERDEAPNGPEVRECLRREGGRCIRWR